jgi:hypothetical protein
MLEIQPEKVHDEIHGSTTTTLGACVPKLWPGAKQFDVLASDISMPTSSALVGTRLEAAIFFGVIRQRT